MSLEPTFYGYAGSSNDALLIFEAARSNIILNKVNRRPRDRERARLIRSGNIFVFSEPESGIRRWSDGVAWSPSRILGNFHIYRELERPLQPGELRQRAQKRGLSASARRAASDDPHWTDSYGFKDGGLIKKTMSVEYEGMIHHLVAYYTIDDVMLKRLPSPMSDPRLANLEIGSDLMNRTNFRVYPGSENGPRAAPIHQRSQMMIQHGPHQEDPRHEQGYPVYHGQPPPVHGNLPNDGYTGYYPYGPGDIVTKEWPTQCSQILVNFLQTRCAAQLEKCKVKLECEITVDVHWTTRKDSSVACQYRIDSGAFGDVYQVSVPVFSIVDVDRCTTRLPVRYHGTIIRVHALM
jgi:Gti1/Pac2 family transcription factor